MNDLSNNTPSLIPEVGLTEIDGQPRARDLDIGERLGFERPRDIRKLIKTNMEELERFGVCATAAQTPSTTGGRPATEFWLNEEQVLLVSALSNAPHASAVRAMLIRVFVAWRRGHLVAREPMPSDLVEYIRRTDGISRMLSHKVTEMEKANATMLATLTAIAGIVQPSHPVLVRHGKTAGQIWADHGFQRIKITSWFSNRLIEQGCLMEGKAEVGGRAIRLFDPDKADVWLRNGGRLLVEQKIVERRGQGKLRLVGVTHGRIDQVSPIA